MSGLRSGEGASQAPEFDRHGGVRRNAINRHTTAGKILPDLKSHPRLMEPQRPAMDQRLPEWVLPSCVGALGRQPFDDRPSRVGQAVLLEPASGFFRDRVYDASIGNQQPDHLVELT